MDYFPLFVNLTGQRCLVVGGGGTASRKARMLLKAGAQVTILAPDLSPELLDRVEQGQIEVLSHRFDRSQLTGYRLVIAATNDPTVNREVFETAEAQGVLVNSVDDPLHSRFITPAIVDRSPIQIAISSGGSAPVLVRRLREQLEKQLPQRLGNLAAMASRWRQRVKSRFSEIGDRRAFWERLFDSRVPALVESGQEPLAERRLGQLLEAPNHRKTGHLSLVGAGPGEPGLLTLRALQVMQQADVVLHDRLVSAPVLEMVRRDAELISVGKKPGEHTVSQQEIQDLLLKHLQRGKHVVRLKGGDPFVFGRGGEELEAIAGHGFSTEVVPGMTAAIGCASYAGIPLTHRDYSHSIQIITAHCKKLLECVDWLKLARSEQTLVFYMGVKNSLAVQQNLIKHGLSTTTPVAFIENGTTPEQRVLTGQLSDLAALGERNAVKAPALIVVGEVIKLQESCQWQEPPLSRLEQVA